MKIRRAKISDIERIGVLLRQVCRVHFDGRPDLFKNGAEKYNDKQLADILQNEKTPVFAATDDNDVLVGYAFCVFKQFEDDNIMTDVKTLYIDDLCVDETQRGEHIGTNLLEYVKKFAKDSGCYNITLNVWSCNKNAHGFYESHGLVPQKIGMEMIL